MGGNVYIQPMQRSFTGVVNILKAGTNIFSQLPFFSASESETWLSLRTDFQYLLKLEYRTYCLAEN